MTTTNQPVGTKETPKTGINWWNLSGKVLDKKSKYTGNGNLIVELLIKVPAKNVKYDTVLWLKAFKETAEQIEASVEKDKNYSFSGYFSNNNYEKDGKKVYRTDFVVNKFVVAQVDEPKQETSKSEDAPF